VSEEFNSKVVTQYSLNVHNYMGPMDIRITNTYLVPRIYEVPVVKYKITSKSIKAYF